jgi:hypothetical protein
MKLESFLSCTFLPVSKACTNKLCILRQCKYIKEEKLIRENKVEGIDIMQISGHKNVAFINNYSTLSEE